MNTYLVGANVPGYLPEADPIECGSMEEAREVLYAEALHACDSLADTYGEWSEVVRRAINEAATCAERGEALMPTSDSPHDLGVVLWIAQKA